MSREAEVTNGEAAELAGVTVRQIKRWRDAGSLTWRRDPANGRIYITRRSLQRKLATR